MNAAELPISRQPKCLKDLLVADKGWSGQQHVDVYCI